MLTTEFHKIPSGTYMRAVATEWLGRWWWMPALPLAACFAAAATESLVWAVVGFIILCIVLPLLMMMLYFRYALTPEAVAAVRMHRLVIDSESGIDVEFAPDAVTERTYQPVHIDWNNVKWAEIHAQSAVLTIGSGPYRLMIIPLDSVTDNRGDDLVRMLEIKYPVTELTT